MSKSGIKMSPISLTVLVFTIILFIFMYLRYTNYSSSPIGIVVCYTKNNTGPRDEASVLIKSTILSAQTYTIIKTIEIHIFMEHLEEDSKYFSKLLNDFGQPFENLEVRLFFKSALHAVPAIYRNEITSGLSFAKFRCAKLRLFFPTVLPTLDSILYLDTDIIITGNLAEIWNHFKIMDKNQLIGITNDYEDHSPRKSDWVSNIPIPPPKGLNSGVLLMNLTKMREMDWEAKLLRINKDYSKIADDLNDQASHCDEDSTCYSAADNGAHVVHGAASHFSETGKLHQLYLTYKNFYLKNSSSLHLLLSTQNLFQVNNKTSTKTRKNSKPSCKGVLDSLILQIVHNLPNN